jgi:UDP-N-acetyl-D-mannosaminuronate dehydrogenase
MVAQQRLSLAINGRERLYERRLVPFCPPEAQLGAGNGHPKLGAVAIVGLGYVGLPTALALLGGAAEITGYDISEDRLRDIKSGEVDLCESDRALLDKARADTSFQLTTDATALSTADAVIICVPTPVDEDHVPDLVALRSACQTVVAHAHPGQTIILTSTSFVGTTRQLLVEPLRKRGLIVGTDVYVAFSPERIDPGNPDHIQRETPRVVGGVSRNCSLQAARVIGALTDSVYLVSSPEAAELTKLYENIFRAVTLALANEFSDVCATLGLDPIEVTLAAGTKPYDANAPTPLIKQAMHSIHARPARVVERAAEVLDDDGRSLDGAKVIVVGVSYKAGVSDVREAPALLLIDWLIERGAEVAYYDPLVPTMTTRQGRVLSNTPVPSGAAWDLAIIQVVHPATDYSWVQDCPRVLDATYLFDAVPHRSVV